MTATDTDARFWNRAARKYAQSPIKDVGGYERTLAETLKRLGRDSRVLEYGCGTGTTALRIAPHVAHFTATDLSAEMITIAREKAQAAGVSNVDFTVGTPDRMAWPDATFDAVLAYNVLHLLDDRAKALTETLRVLKPGGLFISKTTCLAEMNRLLRVVVPVMQKIGKAPHVDFFTAPDLVRSVRDAGFSVLEEARHGTKGRDARVYIVAQKPRG